ncbi:MAG TPA: amino acid adenylation domain-containing protein [Acidobacteriaceae bacterium]|jgi:amino acid adenylation domain-containing protein|nr:amino acid adenylation domain-containing protein [Acidobacteriaceae bacterium]
MREIIDLLGRLWAQGVSLTADGDSLKCAAPPGVLTAELRAELAQRKPEILAFLRSSKKAAAAEEVALQPVDRRGPLPLSYAQQRLWFLCQLDPESPVYNISMAVTLSGRLDTDALERAIREIIHRQESLRTCFLQENGVPRVVIRDEVSWSLQRIDARAVSAQGPAELARYASGLMREAMDITRAPLLCAQLLTVAEESHILLLTVHHIVFDGWSIGVFVRELEKLYRAHVADTNPNLPPLGLQYVDFAAWQRRWLESGVLDRQLTYWKQQLAGAPPVVTFPADRRRPQAEMFRGARRKIVIPPDLLQALESLSQRQGVTLFMTLLASFDVLLARYTGQEDIVIGSPSAGRSRSEFAEVMGFFVNNLVLRADLSGNPTFAALLTRVRETTLQAYEHQDVPFDQLVQALRPERSPDHSPLFQTMFILQNFPIAPIELPDVVLQPMELGVSTARFDLTVEAFPHEGALDIYFDYNSDLYHEDTIARLQAHYQAILDAVVADPNQAIGEIPLLSPAEREKLLLTWNQTEAPIAEGLCFHHRFEEIARTCPDRVALMVGDEGITCGELNARADRIAAALRTRGAAPDQRVGVFLPRGADLVAALLGVAKSGAAYVPLDPVYPKGRIENILEDARPVAVITVTGMLDQLPLAEEPTLCLDRDGALPSAADASTPIAGANQQNLAYVIFTSGSTGRPKGVQISHRALLNFLEAMREEPGFNEKDVLLAVTTVSFDIAGLELLLPLYVGATVCIALQPGDPASLLRDLDRYRPTMMQATPATWKLLLAAGWQGDPHLKILCGGEALETGLADALLVRCDELWNMYGPTETTIWSAAWPVRQLGANAIPVGRPIRNTTFYVLDPMQQPVPQGVVGELWIGGEGLARGYLHRPDLTAERFVPCPWARGGETRMYRTGDLVRYRSDGTLDFYGRADFQVKLRGFRIELGEIDNALRQGDRVTDAVTLLREDEGEKRLVAWIEHTGEAPAPAVLRDALRETLPDYMIPAAFVFLEKLPRLPNGKLDRSSLPNPEMMKRQEEAFAAPAAGTQQILAQVLQEVLQVDRVGADENFFDLGAHSLQMVRVHSALNQRLDKPIPLVALFQYPNVRALSSFIDRAGAEAASRQGLNR